MKSHSDLAKYPEIVQISEYVWEISGHMLRSSPPDRALSYFHGLFKRENDYITYVTISRNTWKHHETTFKARILTFYDVGIAYIINMDVIDTSSEIPYYTRIEKGTFDDYSSNADIFKPIGINEIRFMDCPICIEAFLLTYKIFNNVVNKYPTIDMMLDILPFSFDISDLIYNFSNIDINQKFIDKIIDTPFETPFKVQGMDHGTKRAKYRVVMFSSNNEDDPDNTWFDMDETPYEDEDL